MHLRESCSNQQFGLYLLLGIDFLHKANARIHLDEQKVLISGPTNGSSITEPSALEIGQMVDDRTMVLVQAVTQAKRGTASGIFLFWTLRLASYRT